MQCFDLKEIATESFAFSWNGLTTRLFLRIEDTAFIVLDSKKLKWGKPFMVKIGFQIMISNYKPEMVQIIKPSL